MDTVNFQRPLLDEMQVAKMLSVSPRTLQAWRLRGNGPAFVRVGSRIRYCPNTVAAWLRSRSIPGPSRRKAKSVALARGSGLSPRMVELVTGELARSCAGEVHFGASAQRRLYQAIGPHEATLARALCEVASSKLDGTIRLVVARNVAFADAHLSPDTTRIAVEYSPCTGQWISDVAAGNGGFDQLCGHVWRIQGRRGGMAARDLLAHIGAAYLTLLSEGRAA